MRDLVWNSDEHRLRALVRLVGMAVLLVASSLILVVAAALLVGPQLMLRVASGMELTRARGLAVAVLAGHGAMLASVALAAWLLDRRPLRALGLVLDRAWWRDLLAGLVLGAVLIGGVFAVLLGTGSVEVTDVLVAPPGTSPAETVVLLLVAVVGIGLAEELLVRGYLLTNIAEGLRGWLGSRGALLAALGVTAVVFGAMHALNTDASVLGTVSLVGAGLFLGLGYVLTGRLALPIGAHITWNLFLGPVFGLPVSGMLDPSQSVLATEAVGPVLLTGGGFGPEAGLPGLAASLVGIGLVLAWVRRTRGAVQLDHRIAAPRVTGRPA